MPSTNYRIIFKAIQKKQLVRFNYKAVYDKEMCPHVLGRTDGLEKMLGYQTAGESEGGLPPPEGDWRCCFLNKITNLEAIPTDNWRGGDSHTKPNTCVKDVDIDVNRNAKQHYVWPDQEASQVSAKAKPYASGKKSKSKIRRGRQGQKRKAGARKSKRTKKASKGKSPA